MKKINKKIISIILLATIIFVAPFLCLSFFKNGDDFYVDDINVYRQQLSELNEKYSEDFDNRIIVKSKRLIKDNKAVALASGFAGLNVIQYNSKEDAENALEYYSSLDYVDYARGDFKVTTQEITTLSTQDIDIDNLKHLTWGADLLGVDFYQEQIKNKYLNQDLPEIYVAVLDTGIDTDNEFLKGRIALDKGISYYDSTHFSSGKSLYNFEDDNSHGTHVSGTIVDLTLDNVKIIPVKILNNKGSGSFANIISGMEYILNLKEQGVNVVAYNMSLGGYGYSSEEEQIVNQSYQKNIMPVVAAGNDNFYAEAFRPASCPNVLTISALSQNEYYSNFPHLAYYSNFGPEIDLALPGTNILSCVPDDCTYENIYSSSTNGKYAIISGTSMATPHACALVALYATYYGEDYDVSSVENLIKSSTYDFGKVGKDDMYGYGVPCLKLSFEDDITFNPSLNIGEIDSTYNFSSPIEVEISSLDNLNQGYNLKIYYTLDGSVPTLLNHLEYTAPIQIDKPTFLKFVFYIFDNSDIIRGHSKIYECTYLNGTQTTNDSGEGFEINSDGVLTKYTSGLKEITIPESINGIKVTALASNLFYGLGVEKVICKNDISIEKYPFYCCPELEEIELYSTTADYISSHCQGLKALILPNITSLLPAFIPSTSLLGFYGSDTFVGCFNLEKFVAPKVQKLPSAAFSYFQKLKKVDIDWENLSSIDSNAFENCLSFNSDIVLNENFNLLGEYAFSGSGITSIKALGLQNVYNYTFSECLNLKSVELPQVRNIYDYAFYNSKNIDYIFIGNNRLNLRKSSLSFSSSASPKIYCYDKDYISKFTDISCIDISPNIEDLESENVRLNLTGYDLSFKLFSSTDEILDESDILLDYTLFSGLNYQKEYNFDNLPAGEFYYLAQVTDLYNNIYLINFVRQSNKQVYTIEIESNVGKQGLQISPLSHFYNDEVELILNPLMGYTLNSITLDEVDITNLFENNKYTFMMPERNVKILINYSPIQYNIKSIISGEGSLEIKNDSGEKINYAFYEENITLSYNTTDDYYIKSLYFLDEQDNKTILQLNSTNTTTFKMPSKDITIYIEFSLPDLDDFTILTNALDYTYKLLNYSGTNAFIKVPQYYNYLGKTYRFAGISSFCFENNENLESVSVNFIDEQNKNIVVDGFAFNSCKNLREVNIGKISTIGNYAFAKCYNLQSIDLSYCKNIGNSCFSNCTSITDLNLSSCTKIGTDPFNQCYNLENVILSENLTEIPEKAFAESKIKVIDLKNVQILGEEAFYYCQNLMTVIMSPNIKNILERTFYYCEALKEIDLENVETIEEYAFYSCTSLERVLNPTKLKLIPQYAFGNCKSLEEFDLSKCEIIKSMAFWNCNLKIIDISSAKEIDNIAFLSCANLDTIILGSNEYLIKECQFYSYYNHHLLIDKSYTGEIGAYILQNYSYKYENENYIIYANINYCTATFQFEDGTIIKKIYYNWGDQILPPEQFTFGGVIYTPINWRVDGTSFILTPENFGKIYRSEVYILNEFVTDNMTFTINFYYGYDFDQSGIIGDKGDIFYTTSCKYGENIVFPSDFPTKESDAQFDYIFRSWQYKNEDISTFSPISDMDIIASFTSQTRTYVVQWYNENNELIYSEELSYGTYPSFNLNDYSLPTKESEDVNNFYYQFLSWTPEIDMVKENISYYPTFSTLYYEYTIEFYYGYDYDESGKENDANDIFKTIALNYNDIIEPLSFNHSYSNKIFNFTFKGWDKEVEGKKVSEIFELFENRLLKVYATYNQDKILYSVSWLNGDNSIIYTDHLGYGERPEFDKSKPEPTKKSSGLYKYVFIGWDGLTDDFLITEDISFKPSFKEYNILNQVDSFQEVDVSSIGSIKWVEIDVSDLQNKYLNVKFQDVEIKLDEKIISSLLENNNKSLKIKIVSDKNPTSKNGIEQCFSLLLTIKIDNVLIENFEGDITASIKIESDNKLGVWQSKDDKLQKIASTNLNEKGLQFTTNRAGEFIIGYKTETYNLIIVVVIPLIAVIIALIVIFVYFSYKRNKKIKLYTKD